MNQIHLRLTVVILAGLFAACSSTFDQRWKEASTCRIDATLRDGTRRYVPMCPNGATRWDGKWISEKHHEDGHLRSVLERKSGKLVAHFHANWLIFSNNFDMTLEPTPGPQPRGVLAYHGTQELPEIFGGTYQYQATVEEKKFTARYSSNYDYGTFALHRVLP